ncbi:MAG: twin-arginine translocase subunit TatC [candidate division Zixibacteria bacterium]|nr:twin-arginine translocase subunit TatC [candidate division Zixibacteria bacterium]
MSFLEHLEELRWRLIKSVAAVLILSIVAYIFSDQILEVITRPIDQVYFTGPTEAFAVRIKISVFTGLFLALPVIFYQAWQFVVPGLHAHESRMVIPVVLLATLFFMAGSGFCFFLVLPVGIKFLLGFGTDKLKPLIAIDRYVSFVTWMTLSFGLVFELPIISYFLGRVGIITSRMLSKARRVAIVVILIVAAALTPGPDVFSQMMLATPLYLLYEISIIVVRLTGRRESA